MAETPKRLYGPAALGTSAATVYTVPALTRTVLRSIRVCNESAGAVLFTLSIGTDAAGKRLYYQVSIPAKSVMVEVSWDILTAAEVIQAYCDTATALTLTLNGVEMT